MHVSQTNGTITYTKTASGFYEGTNWVMYTDLRPKETHIFHELKEGIEKLHETPFDNLYDKIRELYNNKTSRSNCDIHRWGDKKHIEISKPNKCLPTIWICKNNKE